MSQSAKGNEPQGGSATARRARASAAGETVLAQTAAAFTRAGFADPTLVLRWPEIAGQDVARLAQPVKLQEGERGLVLTLRCDPGASVFLQHQTRALIERLNSYLGGERVARIRLLPGIQKTVQEPLPHPLRGKGDDGKRTKPEGLNRALEQLGSLRETLKS
jgi:hypothetical protein